MPLYNYLCINCNTVVEKFQHKLEEIDIECKECDFTEFERILGIVFTKMRMNANDTLKNRINPEVDRIYEKLASGSDKDFLDVAGD